MKDTLFFKKKREKPMHVNAIYKNKKKKTNKI